MVQNPSGRSLFNRGSSGALERRSSSNRDEAPVTTVNTVMRGYQVAGPSPYPVGQSAQSILESVPEEDNDLGGFGQTSIYGEGNRQPEQSTNGSRRSSVNSEGSGTSFTNNSLFASNFKEFEETDDISGAKKFVRLISGETGLPLKKLIYFKTDNGNTKYYYLPVLQFAFDNAMLKVVQMTTDSSNYGNDVDANSEIFSKYSTEPGVYNINCTLYIFYFK